MPMAEAAAQATNLVDYAVSVLGFGGLGTLGAVGFAKLRTEVRLYRAENQKDHKEIKAELKVLNGTGRANEVDIEGIKKVCAERHPK